MEETALFEVLVGFACNNNCRFCSIDFEKRMFNKSTSEIKEDILRAKESGTEIIGFTGGEPTIRKDIIELVKFAKKQGFRTIRFQTNGRMFSNKEFTNKIINAGANYFKFSVHAHKASIHDYLTQVPGSFEQSIQGIKNIRALNRSVEVNTVLNKKNYRFFPQTVKFLLDLGISQYTIIFPSYIGNALTYSDEIVVRISDVMPYVKEALDIIEDYCLEKAVTVSIPPCFMIGYEKFGTAELSTLKTKVRGPGFEVNLDDKVREEKRKCEKCSKCCYDLICGGLRYDYVDLFGFDEIKPVKGRKYASAKEISRTMRREINQ